jgi:hypothetical protein
MLSGKNNPQMETETDKKVLDSRSKVRFIIERIQTYNGYKACVENVRYEGSGISLL